MTVSKGLGVSNKMRVLTEVRSAVFLVLLILFCAVYSREAAEYTLSGIRLALMSVIPSAFPAMLLSDLYIAYGSPEGISVLRILFTRLFAISPSGLRPYVLGSLCGFPLGARATADAYSQGELKKSEAQKLIALSSNPSPPFVIGGVGMGMLGDLRLGILLLLSLYASSVICGALLRRNHTIVEYSIVSTRQNYSLTESIKRAGEGSLMIISFITAFSIVGGFINAHVKSDLIRTVLFLVCEVTVGVEYFTSSSGFSALVSIAAIAFTLGFGGISVMLQSRAFVSSTGLSMRGYVPIKLLQALICSTVAVALYLLLQYKTG